MKFIERPGFVEKRKAERFAEWDEKFGAGKWGFVWKFGEGILDFEQACGVYEAAYFVDSFRRKELWKHLFSVASNFYDNAESNVNSGLKYTVQEAESTHLQDIAVRRVGVLRGWELNKNGRLVQIRGQETEGHLLMPGIVKFYSPELIIKPDISPWWANDDSVEAFYQNNRWLAVDM